MLPYYHVNTHGPRADGFWLAAGLTSWVHWVAWFIKYFIFMMLSVTLISVMLVYGRVFENSEFTAILMLFALYATSTITFCFFLSTLFDSANTAAAAGGLLYFLAYVPSYFAAQLSATERTAACLLGPSCLGFGIEVLARHEVAGQGLQWSNLDAAADEQDTFTMGTVFMMLLVGASYCDLSPPEEPASLSTRNPVSRHLLDCTV